MAELKAVLGDRIFKAVRADLELACRRSYWNGYDRGKAE
jgi:hypothetical protein